MNFLLDEVEQEALCDIGTCVLGSCGYQRATIQSDCLEVAKVLQDTPSVASSLALIRCIQQLLTHVEH
ncbi:hypothetical protein Gohar_000109 [Gossypium harknessii]|uniref:RNase H type-1 domain-containing protein n=1 Tax=Gossypium harknessii TaxID=34285 RepID=A0A7J9IA60_9ROSI|nr:hypothetical protein [Gossypium harknessii]